MAGNANSSYSEIVFFWQLHVLGVLEVLLHLSDLSGVDLDLTWGEHWGLNESQVGLATKRKQVRIWLKEIDRKIAEGGILTW